MNIDNPVLSQTEEPSAQEWGKEADEVFSLVAQLLGDILAWLGSALPLSPRAAAEQAVLAERGQALRDDRSGRPGDDAAGRWLRLQAWWQDVNAWAQPRLTGPDWRQYMESDLQGVKAHLQVVDERLATMQADIKTMQADIQAIQTRIQSMQAEFRTMQAEFRTMQAEFRALRAMVEPLDAKHRGETWEDHVLQSVPRYFREHLTARYETESKVDIEILCTDRDARREQREFTKLWCGNQTARTRVSDPTLADGVLHVESAAWHAVIVVEASTRADDQDVARVLSRAEWLRNGITPPDAKLCCVVPCITALDWVWDGETGMSALQVAEEMGVACLTGQYVAERGQTLQLIPASSFAEWVAYYGQDAFRPRAPRPVLEPGPIEDSASLTQALRQQVRSHSRYGLFSVEAQGNLIAIGTDSAEARAAMDKGDWNQAWISASRALAQFMDRKP